MAQQDMNLPTGGTAPFSIEANFASAQNNFDELYRASAVSPLITGIHATDTAAINAALLNGNVHVLIDGNVTINAPLVVYSNTHLELTPRSSITFPAGISGVGPEIVNRSAFNPQRTVTDVAATAGSTTITSVNSNFTSADVGRSMVISVAGALNGVLCPVIKSITDEATAVLSIPAQFTVSGATAVFYDRDTNIKLSGGFLSFPSVRALNGTGTQGNLRMQVFMRRIDGLVIDGMKLTSGATAKYGISIGDCTRFRVNNIDFNSYADGVHIVGPANDGTVTNISGTTRDDATALTPIDYAEFRDVQGEISNIRFENVDVNSTINNTFKIAGGAGAPCKNIIAKNYANTVGGVLKAQVFDDPLCGIGTRVDGLTLENWREGSVQIGLSATGGGTVSCKNIENLAQSTLPLYRSSFYAGSGAVWDSILIDGFSDFTLSSGFYVMQVAGANIGSLKLNNIDVLFNDTNNSRVLDVYGSIAILSMSSVSINKGNSLVYQNTGSVVGMSKLTNISADGASRLYNALTPANIVISGLTIKNPANQSFYVSGGTLTLSGSGYNGQRVNNSIARAAAEVVNVAFPDLPVSLTHVTKYSGGAVYNINATLGCGVGPVVSDGTVWKHLVSGLTYTP